MVRYPEACLLQVPVYDRVLVHWTDLETLTEIVLSGSLRGGSLTDSVEFGGHRSWWRYGLAFWKERLLPFVLPQWAFSMSVVRDLTFGHEPDIPYWRWEREWIVLWERELEEVRRERPREYEKFTRTLEELGIKLGETKFMIDEILIDEENFCAFVFPTEEEYERRDEFFELLERRVESEIMLIAREQRIARLWMDFVREVIELFRERATTKERLARETGFHYETVLVLSPPLPAEDRL